MIEFTPDRLEIRDFRGLPSIDLDIHSGTPAFLIGPNNSGKSTVLSAMAFALKGGGFHKFTPQPYDFLHHADGSHEDRFSIRLYFRSSDQLPSVHTVGAVTEVHALEVEGRYYKTSGRLEHTHRLLDNEGKSITLVTETPVKKEDAGAYADAGHGYKLRNAHYGDIREFLPEVWLLSAKKLQPSHYAWKTGPLSKLASLLSGKFFQEKWEFEHKGKKRKMPTGIEQAHKFFSSAVKEFPFWKETLKPAMEAALSSYLGSQTSVQLSPLIQSVEDWLRQQLLLSGAWRGIPLRRPGAKARRSQRSRRLYRLVAKGSEERQQGDLRRRGARPAGCRLPARFAGNLRRGERRLGALNRPRESLLRFKNTRNCVLFYGPD
ncbi:hypothetical protein BA177_01345 [Woeseia oceani]|uniref:Endonuclease GajA/Old nuclease/RecF-like AAA domain-containing protein n=1 Tax=Woeseia oceani TaxID=1548547 RepID=A0A193LBY6_9GAMM|nr:AAA family ATPase [Woeseia oceani]ANO50045.1 hypothetical protein BA177_01345 [Woeseia oceani]